MKEFSRIKRLPPYVLEEVNRLKARARANGEDIIDFGMGNPDMPTPPHIIEKLVESVHRPGTNRYSTSRGIPGLRRAQAAYYARRFNVKLNADTEVIATLGSKEGFANVAQAITNPGDVILVPNPTYPIHAFGFIITGGTIRSLPQGPGEDFMRKLDSAVRHTVPKPTVLVLCFPSNPTAAICDLEFYGEVVKYARENDLIILSDLAYAEIYFDGTPPPPSILQIEGAKDIAVEFTTLSKTYAMPGLRMGFAVGNERIIAALTRIKSYLDYGAYTPIQVAAAAALNGPQDCVEEIRQIYQSRRDVLCDAMDRAGWHIPKPPATMFAWAPVPEPFAEFGCLEFSKLLLQHAGVAVAPGTGFGEYGEGFVRIGLVENEQRVRQAARNVRRFMSRAPDIVLEAKERLAAQGAANDVSSITPTPPATATSGA